MAIKVGDKLPEATFMTMTAEGPKPQTTAEVFGGKKVGELGKGLGEGIKNFKTALKSEDEQPKQEKQA